MPCKVEFEGIDLESKVSKKQLSPHTVIHYTPPSLKNDLQSNDLLIAEAYISRHNNDYMLSLNIEINSLKAKTLYGVIPTDSQMKITNIKGDEIHIRIPNGSDAYLNDRRNGYTYYISTPLDAKLRRQLTRNEIDKWGIVFSSGYEEYVVYEIDFFMNQLACLEKTK